MITKSVRGVQGVHAKISTPHKKHFFGGAKKFRRAGVYFLKLGQIVLLLSITYS